ncbi:uncharacterized protein N7469_000919 [Penicillium citrinum]|uniref:Uncharacterized protein n=1 Tax=Penicillium citrinum TaxID=5077 RepID=A0A9W9PF39_PENCI|nr:uncharacterized protein N7469_000919 [Penicillium citrinum]KAJ5242592.1 hypothetical protein N7469_000919 [Penicillium citrinum]
MLKIQVSEISPAITRTKSAPRRPSNPASQPVDHAAAAEQLFKDHSGNVLDRRWVPSLLSLFSMTFDDKNPFGHSEQRAAVDKHGQTAPNRGHTYH